MPEFTRQLPPITDTCNSLEILRPWQLHGNYYVRLADPTSGRGYDYRIHGVVCHDDHTYLLLTLSALNSHSHSSQSYCLVHWQQASAVRLLSENELASVAQSQALDEQITTMDEHDTCEPDQIAQQLRGLFGRIAEWGAIEYADGDLSSLGLDPYLTMVGETILEPGEELEISAVTQEDGGFNLTLATSDQLDVDTKNTALHFRIKRIFDLSGETYLALQAASEQEELLVFKLVNGKSMQALDRDQLLQVAMSLLDECHSDPNWSNQRDTISQTFPDYDK